MSLNNSQYNAIMRIYNQRQFQDKYEQDQRREEVYQKVPQIRQIEDEISSQAVRCARKLLDGDTNAKEELKQHIEDLREQKEVLLSAFGFPADYMEMHYACPECQDTGYVDGRKCRCFKKEEIRLLYSQSNIEEVLLRENFDSFSYEYYDDRVVIPEIKPGIVSGALTAFTMSVDDFIISYFTAGTSASTLAMTIYGMTKKRVSPEINAISTLLFVTVLVLLAIINLRDSHAARREHHAAVSAASGGPVKPHRRPNKLLRRVAAGAMACALVAVLVVTGHSVQSERVVNVCSWGEYIDEELITRFEEQTGIRVNYQTAESNEALYSLIKMGGADFDVIVPSDYMIARLIQEDMLAELDYSHIPNFQLIDDTYKNLSYDPENKYTVPYTWGTLGIIYNTSMVSEPITSWDAMFDPQYAGQVLMINNSRDALAAALLDLGYSINTTDPGQLEEAFNLLKTAKDSGVYQAFVMDEVFQKMEGGNAAIAMYYAGDYLTMLENNEDLAFVIPEEGSNWFVDAMCVLKDTQHMAEAEEWINFIASTDSNLANMDYIWYASPNREALEQYPAYYAEVNEEELDPEIYEIMAPPAETLDRCEIYENLPKDTLRLYDRLWTRLGV